MRTPFRLPTKTTSRLQLIVSPSIGADCIFSEFLTGSVKVIIVSLAILLVNVNVSVPVAGSNEARASIFCASDVSAVTAVCTLTPDRPVIVITLHESGQNKISMSLLMNSFRVLSSHGYMLEDSDDNSITGRLTKSGLSHSSMIRFDTTAGQTLEPNCMDTSYGTLPALSPEEGFCSGNEKDME
jgi:hypothetical protein